MILNNKLFINEYINKLVNKNCYMCLNVEQIIRFPIGGATVQGGSGSYQWFVYIATFLLREPSNFALR